MRKFSTDTELDSRNLWSEHHSNWRQNKARAPFEREVLLDAINAHLLRRVFQDSASFEIRTPSLLFAPTGIADKYRIAMKRAKYRDLTVFIR